MHRSKIEWADDIWNPVSGCWGTCGYCYARKKSVRFAGDVRRNKKSPLYEAGADIQRLDGVFLSETGGKLNHPFGFEPTFHRYRLDYPVQRINKCNILVSDSGDLFGPWVPDDVVREVFEACHNNLIHSYLFLTRYPERYTDLLEAGLLPLKKNFWYGATVVQSTDPLPDIPAGANSFLCIKPVRKAVSILDSAPRPGWIVIGPEDGKTGRLPEREWIEGITEYADRNGVPVFMESGLKGVMQDGMRRELPEDLARKELGPRLREKLETDCGICRVHGAKKEMIALSAQSKRGEYGKNFCYLCRPCFRRLCEQYHITIPDLEGLKEERKDEN